MARTVAGARTVPHAAYSGVGTDEATANLLPTPSFELGVGSWANGTNGTIAQSAAAAVHGSYGATITSAAAGDWSARTAVAGNALIGGATTGKVFTGSASVCAIGNAIGRTVDIELRELGGATGTEIIGFASFTLSATPTRISYTGTVVRNDRLSLDIRIRGKSAADANEVIYVDDVMIEQKAYATNYCDGSLGVVYGWTGIAHASMSYRRAQTTRTAAGARTVATTRTAA